VSLAALLPACVHAEGIDTEHLFGFMIGTDVGNVGEREFQSETTGRFGKNGGRYRAVGQEFELEFVPARIFESRSEARLRRIRSVACRALTTSAGYRGRAGRSICATVFSIGKRR
jgi:hypothetical protein